MGTKYKHKVVVKIHSNKLYNSITRAIINTKIIINAPNFHGNIYVVPLIPAP